MDKLDPVYVGLMSGTSLDGISAAVVRFHEDDLRSHQLLSFSQFPYTAAQRARLLAVMQSASPDEYCRLNVDLGEWFANSVIDVLAKACVSHEDVRAIGSHGHTIWHAPGHSTWQTGEAAVIAERTGIAVVNNFRARDVAAGGQGAPLVPIADALLYSDSNSWRLLQNIGGMANVTLVPPNGDLTGVRAFDTGPGVAILDTVVRELYPSLPYDVDGEIASSGSANDSVVRALLRDPYFSLEPPKSTGREHFGPSYAQALIARCRTEHCTDTDIVATAMMLTVTSISDSYNRFLPGFAKDVIVSGGGAKNSALLSGLAVAQPHRRIQSFDDVFYDGEAKEAVAFALLAHLHLERRAGNVTGATGAHGPRILGSLTPA